MENDRQELHEKFCEILGSPYAYFQPPESVKLNFPAIIYELSSLDNLHANNNVYSQFRAFRVTVVDYDPESIIMQQVSKLPTCRFERHYKSDNLNHWVFNIYN